jgi:hypothetical protein
MKYLLLLLLVVGNAHAYSTIDCAGLDFHTNEKINLIVELGNLRTETTSTLTYAGDVEKYVKEYQIHDTGGHVNYSLTYSTVLEGKGTHEDLSFDIELEKKVHVRAPTFIFGSIQILKQGQLISEENVTCFESYHSPIPPANGGNCTAHVCPGDY